MRYVSYSKIDGYKSSDKLSFQEACNAEWIYDREEEKYLKNRYGDLDAPAPEMIVQETLIFWEYEDGNV
jgi:hypothetical protein